VEKSKVSNQKLWEKEEKKASSSNKGFTADVVTVFCCFELDGGGSNLESV